MLFWLIFSLWLTAVIVPVGVYAWYGVGFKALLVWEVIMFTPLLVLLALIALTVIRPIRAGNLDLYYPKIKVRDYLPRLD